MQLTYLCTHYTNEGLLIMVAHIQYIKYVRETKKHIHSTTSCVKSQVNV